MHDFSLQLFGQNLGDRAAARIPLVTARDGRPALQPSSWVSAVGRPPTPPCTEWGTANSIADLPWLGSANDAGVLGAHWLEIEEHLCAGDCRGAGASDGEILRTGS